MRQASHETVVSLIRKSGDLVKLVVVTVAFEPMLIPPASAESQQSQQPPSASASNTSSTNGLTISQSTSANTNNNNRQYSTLPRKLHGKDTYSFRKDKSIFLSLVGKVTKIYPCEGKQRIVFFCPW